MNTRTGSLKGDGAFCSGRNWKYMWIVRLALRRPYTFVVLSLMLLILAPVVIYRTPTDIFPDIDIPVVAEVFQYSGLSAEDIADRSGCYTERSATLTVNNIEHIE